MPLIVPCTQRRARAHRGDRARGGDAEVVVAVEVHRHVAPSHSMVCADQLATASGEAMPSVSTTTTSRAPASTAAE